MKHLKRINKPGYFGGKNIYTVEEKEKLQTDMYFIRDFFFLVSLHIIVGGDCDANLHNLQQLDNVLYIRSKFIWFRSDGL